MRPTLVIVFDAVKNTLTTVTPVCPDLEVPATSRSAELPSDCRVSSITSTDR
jgi:hypothetical protein